MPMRTHYVERGHHRPTDRLRDCGPDHCGCQHHDQHRSSALRRHRCSPWSRPPSSVSGIRCSSPAPPSSCSRARRTGRSWSGTATTIGSSLIAQPFSSSGILLVPAVSGRARATTRRRRRFESGADERRTGLESGGGSRAPGRHESHARRCRSSSSRLPRPGSIHTCRRQARSFRCRASPGNVAWTRRPCGSWSPR